MQGDIPENIIQDWVVLVVDDDPDALEIAQTLLSFYGAKVVTASNGRQGLEMVKTHRPRFVVADLSMPEMNGWDMVNTLKNDRTLLDIPVVALTAHAMEGDRTRAMATGFHNFLTKPLKPETFVQELLTLLKDDIPELAQSVGKGN